MKAQDELISAYKDIYSDAWRLFEQKAAEILTEYGYSLQEISRKLYDIGLSIEQEEFEILRPKVEYVIRGFIPHPVDAGNVKEFDYPVYYDQPPIVDK